MTLYGGPGAVIAEMLVFIWDELRVSVSKIDLNPFK